MKIEQKHLKHKTWMTLITVGKRQFGLQTFPNGRAALHEGRYEGRHVESANHPHGRGGGGMFHVTGAASYDSKEEALEWCRALGDELTA